MRILGKRQIGQLQPFELAIAIIISELAAMPMEDTNITIIQGITPILVLIVLQILLSFSALKSVKFRELLCGKPSIVIENGKIVEKNLRKELLPITDLLEHLRINEIPTISDVEIAILETNGQLSVIKKSQKRTVTPEDLGINTQYEGLPLDLIIDGSINYNNLKKINLDMNWLIEELSKQGYSSYKHILYAMIDTQGNLYLQGKDK